MRRGVRRFWLSVGFVAGFVIRDLMEEESSVRTGLRTLWDDTKRYFEGRCCPGEGKEETAETGDDDNVTDIDPENAPRD